MSSFVTNELIENFEESQNEANLTSMESSADTYEQTLNIADTNLELMEAIADVYDLLSEMKGDA